MADINLNELRATAERLAGQTTGLKGDRLTIERAIAGDHFSPEVVQALLDRVADRELDREGYEHDQRRIAELEAVVARVEALAAEWDREGSAIHSQMYGSEIDYASGQDAMIERLTADLRTALAGESGE